MLMSAASAVASTTNGPISPTTLPPVVNRPTPMTVPAVMVMASRSPSVRLRPDPLAAGAPAAVRAGGGARVLRARVARRVARSRACVVPGFVAAAGLPPPHVFLFDSLVANGTKGQSPCPIFASMAKWSLTWAIASSEMAQASCAAFACSPCANGWSPSARSRRRANTMRSPCGSSTLSMPSFSKRSSPSNPCLPPGCPSASGTH